MTQVSNKFENDVRFYDEDIEGPMPLIDYPTDEYDNADELVPEPNPESNPVVGAPEPNSIIDDMWSELVVDSDYEINDQSHLIRKKDSHYFPIISIDKSNGYNRLKLNNKKYYLHRILALQYISNPNPEHFREVDHINRNRTDNTLSNLRWVSRSSNSQNLSGQKGHLYEWTDKLPDDVEPFTRYNTHEISNLYKTLQNEFYKEVIINNRIQYRRMVVSNQGETQYIQLFDTEGNHIKICLSMI
jgi:hypothetical protein